MDAIRLDSELQCFGGPETHTEPDWIGASEWESCLAGGDGQSACQWTFGPGITAFPHVELETICLDNDPVSSVAEFSRVWIIRRLGI